MNKVHCLEGGWGAWSLVGSFKKLDPTFSLAYLSRTDWNQCSESNSWYWSSSFRMYATPTKARVKNKQSTQFPPPPHTHTHRAGGGQRKTMWTFTAGRLGERVKLSPNCYNSLIASHSRVENDVKSTRRLAPGAGFIKLFVRKFVRTKSYEVRKKVRKCDSQNFRTNFVKIRCVSGREWNKPIRRYYTTHAAAYGKSFYTERKKACLWIACENMCGFLCLH